METLALEAPETSNTINLGESLEEPRFLRKSTLSGVKPGICLYCGGRINENRMRYRAKYCSNECKEKYHLDKVKKRIIDLNQTCMFCGDELAYRKKRYNAKYCSASCRDHAKIERAEKKVEEKLARKQKQRDLEREAWEEYDNRFPTIYEEIESDAVFIADNGLVGHLSIGAIIEYRIRMWLGFQIPNAYKKYYREKFIRERPEYAELFK